MRGNWVSQRWLGRGRTSGERVAVSRRVRWWGGTVRKRREGMSGRAGMRGKRVAVSRGGRGWAARRERRQRMRGRARWKGRFGLGCVRGDGTGRAGACRRGHQRSAWQRAGGAQDGLHPAQYGVGVDGSREALRAQRGEGQDLLAIQASRFTQCDQSGRCFHPLHGGGDGRDRFGSVRVAHDERRW